MPATVCHAYFCMDVYKHLGNHHKRIDSTDLGKFRMFGQSTDPMMFYNIESLQPGKHLRSFQYYFHTHNSQDFFVHLCHTIRNKNLIHCSEVLAFLYGFICHYVLDSTVHPFVIYKTGIMDKKDPSTYKYNGGHTYMETYIDNIIIKEKLNEEKPFHFRLDKYCFAIAPFSASLCDIIDSSFLEIFGISNMSHFYYKSLKQMKSFLRKYRYDPLGIKKLGYETIDFFTSKRTFKFRSLSYHYISNNHDYLNLSHKTWYNSTCLSIQSNDSFYDLYEKALEEAISIICKVNDFFDGKDISLEKVFTNKSYLTGLDCNRKASYKKFEF